MKTGYELFEHTADVGVHAWGERPEEVFEHAASAMFSLICDPLTIDRIETMDVRVEAGDRELLLAAWLNELIFLFESRRILFIDFEVLELDDTHVVARVSGEPLDPSRHAVCGGVKAATLHQLSVRQRPEGWEGFVILDV
jgi:SHS2 domain-containing protein